jgi:hypothetical protein
MANRKNVQPGSACFAFWFPFLTGTFGRALRCGFAKCCRLNLGICNCSHDDGDSNLYLDCRRWSYPYILHLISWARQTSPEFVQLLFRNSNPISRKVVSGSNSNRSTNLSSLNSISKSFSIGRFTVNHSLGPSADETCSLIESISTVRLVSRPVKAKYKPNGSSLLKCVFSTPYSVASSSSARLSSTWWDVTASTATATCDVTTGAVRGLVATWTTTTTAGITPGATTP